MPTAQPASGSTWNTAEDLKTAYVELNTGVSDTMLTRACEEAQGRIKDRARGVWDVDSTDFSTANIGTNAPTIKYLHLKLAAAIAYLRQFGCRVAGAGVMYDYAERMEREVWEELDALIRSGALPVGRQEHPDFGGTEYSNVEDTDPYFDHSDETTWPADDGSDNARDDNLYSSSEMG
jgi:hypothetical protein